MKKFTTIVLIALLVLSVFNVSFSENFENEGLILKMEYHKLLNYAQRNNIKLDMTYREFIRNYNEGNYNNVAQYTNSYYNILKPEEQKNYYFRGSEDDSWYYNTSTNLPDHINPDYSKYNLLENIQVGDIIYEAKGGFGITGHTAIVEGIYKQDNRTYIRIIEAIDDGVVRSVLDDSRVDDKDVSILRVKNASIFDKRRALNFCINEIGSSYSLDFAKDTSPSEVDWYCSEVIWAGYLTTGRNIETTGYYNEPGITPRDIKHCNEIIEIEFK